MNILMTGMTAVHVRTDGDVRISGAFAMLEALQNYAHHNVTVAPPGFRVNPRDYDLIMCGLYTFNSRGSGYKTRLFEFLHRAYEAGVPVHYYVDDWHLSSIMSSIRRNTPALYKSFERLVVPIKDGGLWGFDDDEELEYVKAHRQVIWDTRLRVGCFQDIPKNTKLFVQFFPWHSAEKLRTIIKWPEENIIPWNPDAFLLDRADRIMPSLIKEREWVVSTPYKDFDKWVAAQNFTWPIARTGRKGFHKERTEPLLFQNVYAHKWGVVSHPYPKTVTGMWRNRYLFALKAGAVIYGPDLETKGLGDVFNRRIVKQYESLPEESLYDLNQLQLKAFLGVQTTAAEELSKFENLV